MLFSAHLADTSVLASLRRKAPKPDDVPGLLGCRNAACAPFTPGVLPRPQLSRECLLAAWEDEASLDAFLETNPTGRVFASGWQARMELVRAVGVWPGLDHDMVAEAALQGRLAGVQITQQSGSPNASSAVRVRGIGTVGNSDPLYVVDGFPMNDISYLNPNDIASMDVLKEAQKTKRCMYVYYSRT